MPQQKSCVSEYSTSSLPSSCPLRDLEYCFSFQTKLKLNPCMEFRKNLCNCIKWWAFNLESRNWETQFTQNSEWIIQKALPVLSPLRDCLFDFCQKGRVIYFYRGIWFSKDVKWNRHIDELTAKANRTLGFLKKNFGVNSSTLKAKTYIGLVRRQVEYFSCVWDSRPGVENNGSYKIEWIQCRVARCCLHHYNNTSSVTNMPEDLGWGTLEQRRMDNRLTALFKVTRGLLSVNSHGLPRPVMCSPTGHLHLKTFIPHQTSLSSEYLSFFSKTIIHWNNLPASLSLANSAL